MTDSTIPRAAHPKGLAFLAATELAERFSYYGMTGLLALYLVKQLLLPDHAGQVLGLAQLRGLFELRGPISNQAFASLIFGWYSGLVYFTPILGGLLADRWLGARRTVILGALLMSAGHLAMSFDTTFLVALVMLILGSGCLKGNIAAQVGALYPAEAESLRARGFTLYATGINIGAVLGPLGAGSVAAIYGWHAGFALAAAVMLVAFCIYLAGQRHFVDVEPKRVDHVALPPLTAHERRRTWALIGLIALTIPANIAYPMIWNIGIVWIDQHVDLLSPFGAVPASWFNSVEAFSSIAIATPLVALWAWQARRGREPGSIAKMGIGSVIIGASALLFALGCATAGADGRVSVLWALAGFFGMGVAFMWFWPILLALISQAAPERFTSTLMGGAYLSLFVGSTLMGWVGGFYDQMSNAGFWILDAAIAFGGALLIFLVRKPLQHLLDPASDLL
ncbi:peptide MFS transporter [Sphingomonas sp. DG1-23]|uniref:peptide MFS transporter n=1 Tax=Sphingomonas sp. DG1-23 TaxID=3068316 RepID=UPI00273D4D4F|nr:peptide MFS transporter [Sphingomonas sp. DG1-23]MDP5278995.1 peptide MFS transporter [Sphingomonas sp. DG1-23]